MSSSVLQAFPTVTPILLDRRPARGAALFASLCPTNATDSSSNATAPSVDACEAQQDAASSLYSVSLGISVSTSFLYGWCFDAFGPRRTAVWGALLTAVGLGMLTIGLSFPSYDVLVWLGVVLADCAGSLTSLSVYGFIWHVPTHQALIAALYSTSVGISAYAATLAVWLVDGPAHVPPRLVWLVFVGMALLSSVTCASAAVGSAEYEMHAEAVMGPAARTRSNGSGLVRALRDTVREWHSAALLNGLFLLYNVFVYCSVGLWAASYVKLESATLSPAHSSAMVALFAPIAGLASSLLQPLLGGALLDAMGLRPFCLLVNVGLVAFLVLLSMRPYGAQLGSLVVGSASQYAWVILVLSWTAAAVPPHLVGTSSGLLFWLAGVVQIGAGLSSGMLASALGARTERERLLFPVLLYGAVGAALSVLLQLSLVRMRLPYGERGAGVDLARKQPLLEATRNGGHSSSAQGEEATAAAAAALATGNGLMERAMVQATQLEGQGRTLEAAELMAAAMEAMRQEQQAYIDAQMRVSGSHDA